MTPARVREIAEPLPGSSRDLHRSVGMTATAPDRGFPAFVRKKTWLTSAQGANQQRRRSGHHGQVTGCNAFIAPVCTVAEPRDSKCGLARNLEPLTQDYSITQLVRQAEVSRFFARPAMLGF